MFGDLEAKKTGYKYRVKKYEVIIEIMQSKPELTYRRLLKLAVDKLDEAEREKNDIRNKISRSFNIIGEYEAGGFGSSITLEFKNSYMQTCKKLLRKLFFLLHSDTCPNYESLSKQKKAAINELWLKLMKSTKEEIFSFSPSMLLYSLPDYDQLELIYKKACEILEINPEDYEIGNRLEFMIKKGCTIEEIIEFLKNETEALELHLSNLELIQNEYTNENETQLYRTALNNIAAHSDKLKNEISDLKEQIVILKKKISDQLNNATINAESR